MNIGLGIGIPFTRSSLWASIFTPSALFLDGSTQGVWYDPSDINLTWRRNLLTYSEQFDNGAWPQNNITISANAAVSPDGTTTADLIYPTTTGGDRRLLRQTDGALTNGLVYTQSIYVKSSGFQWVRLNAVDATSGSDDVWFDVVNGVVGTVGSDAVATQITSAGNGWFRISVTGTAGLNDYFLLALADANNSTSATANGTSGIYIWGAQLEQGSTATPYQRITDGIQDYLQYQAQPVLYQDAAGTTPVTGVEQPVGLMLDKSKGLVLGPNIYVSATSAGATALNANGTVSTSGLQATATCTTAGNYGITFTNVAPAAVGKSYQLKVTIVSQSVSGRVYLDFGGVSGLFIDPPASGVTRIAVNAASTGIPLRAYMLSGAIGNAFTISFEYVSELPGNHAGNPSGNSANFPVLSARYNEFEKTEQFDNAYWGKVGCVVSAPELVGTVLANKVTPSGTNFVNKVITRTGKVRFSVKPNGVRYLLLYQYGSSTFKDAVFDLQLATITRAAAGVSASISLRPDGFLDLAITQSDVVSIESGVQAVDAGTSPANQSYAGGGSYYLSRADLRVANDGINLPSYQRVNTATDYDTVGFPLSLRFNGVNQWLQTNSIDFTYGDKMFVSAGVRKLSDATIGMIAEISTGDASGSCQIYGYGSAYTFASIGTTGSSASASGYPAAITSVLSGIGNISGDQAILRVNGTQAASSAIDQGTGNYGNYPLYIGARAGTSLFFNGNLYQLIIAGGSVINIAEEDLDLVLNESGDSITAETTVPIGISTIEACERFVNRKTLAY